MAQAIGSPSWSDLPPELLGLVFLLLPTRADRAFFPAVCRAWCSAVRQCRLPPPSPVPWLMLPDGSATSFPHRETFQLPDGMRYHNSCGEWLLLSRNDGSCLLMNHLTKATMPLPSLSSYSYYQEPVEAPEDCIPRYYRIRGNSWLDNKDISNISVRSLVVCSTRLVAAIVAVGPLGAIALCRPGATAWSVSAQDECRWLSRMVFFQGKLYALNRMAGHNDYLIAIDIVDEHDSDEPRVSRIECVIEGASLPSCLELSTIRTHYLIESNGTLLMIRRSFSHKSQDWSDVVRSSKFEVFEADIEEHLWAEVRTLGTNQALFLGQGSSSAVHVSPYDLSRNCIFFLDDCTNLLIEKTTKYCRVYDMKDEKIYSPLPMVSWKSERVPATWIFSQGETCEAANSTGGFAGNCGT
ncbi:uncharacterized protein [Miscanthus floridulus]|uniref:uncharacterized protein n=1 Tax=Miscanthus floridulus TaxID=154761 RepID=UPI003458E632